MRGRPIDGAPLVGSTTADDDWVPSFCHWTAAHPVSQEIPAAAYVSGCLDMVIRAGDAVTRRAVVHR